MVVTQGSSSTSPMWISDDYTQLTAVGLTDATKVRGMKNHSFQVTVAAINTNVVIGLQGSTDGTSFGELSLDNTAVATSAITLNRATITSNGTYIYTVKNTSLHSVKFNFISESSGTDATLDVVYIGQS